ncbi:hypothetical protein [Acinetobacter courvalinii]|uniref:Uncharacterized protein n=1 Tax=Acinetobacter courvalinii TaxID=280147 RepID=A0AA42LB55_9GAMM|nr:hypothetical protein [Acinetobacter courvalinii]MDH0563786.1 hypothetical protein [Acinetobacter courvalinii]
MAYTKALYDKVEREIDKLKVGQVKNLESPEFSASEIFKLPEILAALKEQKYKDTIEVQRHSMSLSVKKVKVLETPIFDNLIIEKSEEEIEADKAYNKCLEKKHKIVESRQTTYGNPILICEECKLIYRFKMRIGGRQLASVHPL